MVRLNNDQLKQLADFASNLALIFLAGVFAPLFSNIDSINIFSIVLGMIAASISLAISVLFLKNI